MKTLQKLQAITYKCSKISKGIITKVISIAILFTLAFTMSTALMAFQIPQKKYSVQTAPGPEELEKIADSLSAIYLKKNLLPGITVAVAKDGRLFFLKAMVRQTLSIMFRHHPRQFSA